MAVSSNKATSEKAPPVPIPEHPAPLHEPDEVYDWFGLRETPFSVLPDPRFAYPSNEHQIAIGKMQYAANQKRGLAVLMGPIGVGKTTIAQQLQSEWDQDANKTVAYLPTASERLPAAFLRSVLEGFGQPSKRNESDNKRILHDFLLREHEAGRHPILLIDEGQKISADNIDTISDLTNFKTARSMLITIVILAQDNFPKKLERKDAFRSRIAMVSNLDPLSYEDTVAMLDHRLKTAGGGAAADYIEDEALKEIYNTTQGIPRDICVLCDNVFLAAAIREQRRIGRLLVEVTFHEMKKAKAWPVRTREEVSE